MPILDGSTLTVWSLPRVQDKLGIVPGGGVPASRTITTTAPLTGGGDLSANRTLSIPKATASVSGYMAASDFAKLAPINVTLLTNPYTFTNATPLRTINVSTATLTDALNCLAALTQDLKTAGILPP